MTKLIDLNPQFVKSTEKGYQDVQSIEDSQGIIFDCPGCREHSILIWFRNRNVPDSQKPGPGRWLVSGSSYLDLTISPSINLDDVCIFR